MSENERFTHAAVKARQSCSAPEADAWVEQACVSREAILSTVDIRTRRVRRRVAAPSANTFGLVVARLDRTGPATSIKVGNMAREVSRTVQAAALFAVAEAVMLDKPAPVRVIASLISFSFAAFAATKATIGYNDAVVLHRAWKIAGTRPGRTFSREEIQSVRGEIAAEFHAPKCAGGTEINDVLENLLGLKAIAQDGDLFVLKERIVFYPDGLIRN